MRKRRQNNLVGKIINGYELIEEIKQDIEYKSPQDKHKNRLFRVRKDDVESIKTLGDIKYHNKKLSERINFTDRTGEICGDWEIIEIAEDYETRHGKVCGSLWKARNIKTGEIVIDKFSSISCKYYRKSKWNSKHGYLKKEIRGTLEDSYLYHTWKNTRDRCTKPSCLQYHNWGAIGYRFDDERWGDFITFKKDIGNTIGQRPDKSYVLIPIIDKFYCHNNVVWAKRRSSKYAITKPGNAIIK